MLRQSMASDAPHTAPEHSSRRFVFRVLETAKDKDLPSRCVDVGLILLIALSVVAVVMESMPGLERRYSAAFYWFEVFTVSVFSVEYVLRVWSSVERHETPPASALVSRLRFMCSFHLIVDLLAILPFFLLTFGLFGGVDMRFLRAFRLLRILKLTRYSTALNLLVITVVENAKALLAAFLILITAMLLAASGMYYFEREAQPVAFGSIPAAMWWAFSTLTTVGYGDVTPVTAGGKIFGALSAVVGIGMVALPTSILASGYTQQLKLRESMYQNLASEAWEDGVLDDSELRDLEKLRVDLGLGRHTASQILDERMVAAAMEDIRSAGWCPHCGCELPERAGS